MGSFCFVNVGRVACIYNECLKTAPTDNVSNLVTNMDQQIYSLIVKAISKQKMLDPSSIAENSTLDALGITSLDAISIVYEIEDALDIEVPNEALENLSSVQDILLEVTRLVQARN